MSIWVSWIIGDLTNILVASVPFLKETKNKEKFFWLEYILAMLFIAVISSYLIIDFPIVAKTIIKMLFVPVIFKFLFKKNFSRTLVKYFLICILFAVAEGIYGGIYLGVLKLDFNLLRIDPIQIIISNICISTIVLIVLNLKKVNVALDNIANWYKRRDNLSLMTTVVLSIVILLFFLNRNMNNDGNLLQIGINSTVITIIVIFIIFFTKQGANLNKLVSEYDNLLEYSKTYEKVIAEKGKKQHEYRNQLLVIKSMVDSANKKLKDYINQQLELTDNDNDEDVNWLVKLKNIPCGGLKGIIFYKINEMKKLGLNVVVDISSDIENNSIAEIFDSNLQDISRVVGVYLDNAIEAASLSDKKYIIIEAQLDSDQVIFSFSNTYTGSVEISKIDDEGYSTKGKGKGYGLSLVKDILDDNLRLSQDREMNGIYYVQKLCINISK